MAQDMWTFWPGFGVFSGLWKASFLDNSPLLGLIESETKGRKFSRKVAFQSVDMSTGKVVIFDETIPDELRVSAIASSGSLPVAFPP